jgi:hypothetical protein
MSTILEQPRRVSVTTIAHKKEITYVDPRCGSTGETKADFSVEKMLEIRTKAQ